MLDRLIISKALAESSWRDAAAVMTAASSACEDENEQWRLLAMGTCTRSMNNAGIGRDAVALLRELVRLADGYVHLPARLLAGIDRSLFGDFALVHREDASGQVALELSAVHTAYEAVPDLHWALRMDSQRRRNTRPEPASSFLRRLSPHSQFASDGQKVALHALMMMPVGSTLVVALPTGWGKSALFQIGARRWRESDSCSCVLVIVPTVALALDHARTVTSMPGLSGSRALVGGMKTSDRSQILAAFTAGEVPILFMSPEMALGGAFQVLCEAATRGQRAYDGGHLVAVVIDEAHIIASWGRHFRPDFQRLPGFVQELRRRQPDIRTLLLSATLDLDKREKLRSDFAGGGTATEVVVPEPRDEFDLAWSHIPASTNRTNLVVQVADVLPRPAIIYTTTVEDAETLYDALCRRGYARLALFTGEVDDPVERREILDSWARGDTDLVVATSAFGMGVDKSNVRAIVHACLPESAERFYQEIGRGGRDGHQALSLCLWTDGDAATAASLAIHGWMRPETSIERWKAILSEASAAGHFSHGSSSGNVFIKIPLDAKHDRLGRVTGQLNRQWNAALLTLLQRSGALRIVGEEQSATGKELWLAEVVPEIVRIGPDIDSRLLPFLSVGEYERIAACRNAAELERALLNEDEECSRTALFGLVDREGSPWPCGRCAICMAVGEHPREHPSRHQFPIAWQDHAWRGQGPVGAGAWVLRAEQSPEVHQVSRLVTLLGNAGIQQFVATTNTLGTVERAVCATEIELGLTLLLGGDVPPSRVPTAVLVGSGEQDSNAVRKHCLALRDRFERHWPELPVIFALTSPWSELGNTLSQHLSSRAPMTERDLVIPGGGQ